jgi:hypothetical protein
MPSEWNSYSGFLLRGRGSGEFLKSQRISSDHMTQSIQKESLEKLSEFETFDAVVRKVFSVPHSEIVKREKEYQRKRKRLREKRAKISTGRKERS